MRHAAHKVALLWFALRSGEPLPPDHGYPLRVIVPGYVGVRNIKWLKRVNAQKDEAVGPWQRGIAYKTLGPDVVAVEGHDLSQYVASHQCHMARLCLHYSSLPCTNVTRGCIVYDLGRYAPINELPVTSAILHPLPNSSIEVDEENTVEVRGLAWSGGGRGIARVDVSADDGKTWHTASLGAGSEQPRDQAWAWCCPTG